MKLSRVILYDDPHVPEIDARRLAAFAEKTFHVSVEVRGPLLAGVPERDLLPFVVRDTRAPPGAGRPHLRRRLPGSRTGKPGRGGPPPALRRVRAPGLCLRAGSCKRALA